MAKDIFIKSAEFTLKRLVGCCASAENEDCGINIYLHDFCDVIILLNKLAKNISDSVYEHDQSVKLNYISSLFRNIECNKYISLSLYSMAKDTLTDSLNQSLDVLESRCDISNIKSYAYQFISSINNLRDRCLTTIMDISEENNYFRRFFSINMKVLRDITDNLIRAIHANDYTYFSCEILSLSLFFNDIMRLQSNKSNEEKFRNCLLELNHYIKNLLFKNEFNDVSSELNYIEQLKTVIEVFRNGVNKSKIYTSNRVINILSLLYDDINRSIVWLTDYEETSIEMIEVE